MRLAVIYSGGKDSTLALLKAKKENSVECLINVIPKSEESYLFHFPNVEFVKYQAEAMEIPLLQESGENEEDVLINLVKEAIERYKIEGIVSGVIKSNFQYKKFRRIANNLKISFITPLWQLDEFKVLTEILNQKIVAIITRVAAYPLDESYLGRIIDENFVKEMRILNSKFGINPSGEGGEYETFVLDAPIFKKKILVKSYVKDYKNFSGNLVFKEIELISK